MIPSLTKLLSPSCRANPNKISREYIALLLFLTVWLFWLIMKPVLFEILRIFSASWIKYFSMPVRWRAGKERIDTLSSFSLIIRCCVFFISEVSNSLTASLFYHKFGVTSRSYIFSSISDESSSWIMISPELKAWNLLIISPTMSAQTTLISYGEFTKISIILEKIFLRSGRTTFSGTFRSIMHCLRISAMEPLGRRLTNRSRLSATMTVVYFSLLLPSFCCLRTDCSLLSRNNPLKFNCRQQNSLKRWEVVSNTGFLFLVLLLWKTSRRWDRCRWLVVRSWCRVIDGSDRIRLFLGA